MPLAVSAQPTILHVFFTCKGEFRINYYQRKVGQKQHISLIIKLYPAECVLEAGWISSRWSSV
jgi:hypothetical protein